MPRLDNRLFPRISAKAGNYASFTEGSAGILDLSHTGLFLEDPNPLDVGTALEFELHLGAELLHCRGVVCRSIQGRGMGVQFVDLPPATQAKLERHLNQLAKSSDET